MQTDKIKDAPSAAASMNNSYDEDDNNNYYITQSRKTANKEAE